jgi:hypothetical protein
MKLLGALERLVVFKILCHTYFVCMLYLHCYFRTTRGVPTELIFALGREMCPGHCTGLYVRVKLDVNL